MKGDSPTITTPSGFTLLYGPDSSPTSGSQHVTQAIYYKIATGTESGTITVHIAQTTIVGRAARMYDFHNVAPTSLTEGGGVGTVAHNAVYSAQTVTTSGVKRLAVSFEVIGDNPSGVTSFAGATGGTWTMPTNALFNGNQGSSLFMTCSSNCTND